MPLPKHIISALKQLAELDVSISDIILAVLLQDPSAPNPETLHLNAINDLTTNYYSILNAFRTHLTFASGTLQWIFYQASMVLVREIEGLTDIKTGWHGCAHNAEIAQFESIDASAIAITAKSVAPCLWALSTNILAGNARGNPVESVEETDDESQNDGTNNGHGDLLLRTWTNDSAFRLRDLVSSSDFYISMLLELIILRGL